MCKKVLRRLSRRERQIAEILFARGEATVAEVLQDLPDPPSYSSVRAVLGILVTKGYAHRRKRGRAYVYSPTVSRATAKRSALRDVLHTFFDGSVENVVATLVSMKSAQLSDEAFDRLAKLIEQSRRREKE
ncbi:MAG: BlaI/MecI/CopY family transcriptional regulator [Candidatus Zixiibacteriota bacterium]|nr:MAG: BlaI/MecI/CopY family transcriptional regulator [candidate division Zixibacteria bacterium]